MTDAGEQVGNLIEKLNGEQAESRPTEANEEAPALPQDFFYEEITEDVGFDEDYSEEEGVQYTPNDSPVIDNDELTDALRSESSTKDDSAGRAPMESEVSSVSESGAFPHDGPQDSHRSALPTYLMGIPQLTLSAAVAQGRRGPSQAPDDQNLTDQSPEDESQEDQRQEDQSQEDQRRRGHSLRDQDQEHRSSSSYDSVEDEPIVDIPDNGIPSRNDSVGGTPTVVDTVAEYRGIVGAQWKQVLGDDPDYKPNPYDSANGWDREAMENYTRFPHVVQRSGTPAPENDT